MSETQPPDLQQMLARAQEVQQKLAQLQQELARRTVEADAGAGMVRAVATGEMRVLEIHIEPALVAEGDVAMLQDLVAAAVNAALMKARDMVQSEMQKAAGPAFGMVPGAS